MNPEFLTEGVAIADFMTPDRIVLGGIDDRTIAMQRQVYAPFPETPTQVSNNTTAEMIKYTSNAVLATLISFSNEIGNLCSALGGVDVTDVMQGVHASHYFTTTLENGRSVKAPITSFLWAGCGFGGSCLPKDTKALSAHGALHGVPMPLLDAVIATNSNQPARMILLLEKHFPVLCGRRIAILGLAFKEDTDDMRESPAIPLAQMLLERGARVIGYDPAATVTARVALPTSVELVESLEAAITGVDAALLVTRWDEFRRLPGLLRNRTDPPLIVDGRRFIDPATVALYEGIGR
jgi:UDPglucose 6-dehydrogenase/GDP-mannose 6-dehydrogenase